jgi:pimeloyl-ACP methyl ester carboxylesterase
MVSEEHPHGTIVLLHGFVSSSHYWSRLAPYLESAGYTVIRLDLLGFGDAPKPHDSVYDYDDHLRHIHRHIKALELTSFTLIGHSMGALLAARYSRLRPEHLDAVILLNPPLYSDTEEARFVLRKTGRIYRFLLDSRFRNYGWRLLRLGAPHLIKAHSNTSRDHSLMNIIEKPFIFDDLAKTTVRTLLLVGSKDRPEYVANLARLQRNSCVTITVENVSHHGATRRPRVIQAAIQKFLSELA